ncbi:MAG: zinc-ribbon domain-containing protein [Candidatus Methanogranum gryphiswaldense]|nr:MAG: zinc-ribbon domain-containing protein [Candidatus Methanogranum sp. U3.2.1]
MEGSKFCTQCGASIKEDDTFCPECGHQAGETSEFAAEYEAKKKSDIANNAKNYTLAIVILCAAWGIFALYDGLSMALNVDTLIQQLKDSDVWETVLQYMTEQQFRDLIATLGYVLAASGVCALIAGLLVGLKKFYMGAVIACSVASVLGLVVIVGVFGFVVVYLITKTKGVFTN